MKVMKKAFSTYWIESIVLIGLNISDLDINKRDIFEKDFKWKPQSKLRIDRLKK
jgi:hypothetical protein